LLLIQNKYIVTQYVLRCRGIFSISRGQEKDVNLKFVLASVTGE